MTHDPNHHHQDHTGPEGRIDCEAALAEVYSFLDDELTVETRTTIAAHLESCGACFEAFDFEAELRMVISAKGGSDEVPDELRIRIIERIEQIRVELPSVDSGADADRPPAGA
jgi:mycothiol system anti-sigma-R factor